MKLIFRKSLQGVLIIGSGIFISVLIAILIENETNRLNQLKIGTIS